ncbi:MAG: N-acetylmuramoyl-L-alanine amidase [Hyphomicrobiales bacterium]|nr:MAG: N-acetylmuramoyl-L-alanine amidase [Hyphomicrobiales bacterium]
MVIRTGRALALLAALCFAAPSAYATAKDGVADESAAVVASAARIAGDDSRTRFILDLDGDIEFTAFLLPDPYRIIVDLPQIDFSLGETAKEPGRGLITAWRYGRFARGQSRIVLDTSAPARIDKSFVLPAVGEQPARLVIDLVKTSHEDFLAEAAKQRGSIAASHHKGDRLPVRTGSIDRPLIVIDPGHGGLDTGTVGPGGSIEKAVVLEFSLALKKQLEASGRFDVRMTRKDDTFIALRKRVDFARNLNADLFISVHADSVREKHVRGASVYTLSEKASDREAELLAAKENKSDIIAGLEYEEKSNDVADILIDLARRETKSFSTFFANTLTVELKSATRLVNRPQRAAGFRVLKAPDVPSILVELGFLSNKHDEQLLTSEEWRQRTAESMRVAVERFFAPRFAASGRDRAVATVASEQQ